MALDERVYTGYTGFICTFIEARSVGVDGLVALYLVREVLVYV